MALPADAPTVSPAERLILIALLVLFIAVNILTAPLSPTVWMDEVLYTDPGFQLARTGSFTTAAWFEQPKGRFFAGNVPLYPVAVGGWISMLGFNITTVRSLNYFIIAIAAWVAHSAAARSGFLRGPGTRLAFIGLFLLGQGMSMSYRWGRPDALTILCTMAAVWCLTLPRGPMRWGLLAACTAIAPAAGLQVAPYYALGTCFLLVYFRKAAFADAISIALGGMIGVAALCGLYYSQGVFDDFIKCVLPQSKLGSLAKAENIAFSSIFRHDWSLLPTLLGTVAGLLIYAKRDVLDRKAIACLLTMSAVTPFILRITGRYPNYYSWMAFIPAATAACAFIERLPAGLARTAFMAPLLAAAVVGLPMRLGLALIQYDARDYRPIERFVSEQITPNDVVACDFAPYYPACLIADEVYVWQCLRVNAKESPQWRQPTIVLCMPRNFDDMVTAMGGGRWEPTGAYYESPTATGGEFRQWLGRQGAEKYQIAVYRPAREGPP